MGFNSGFKGLNVKLRCQKVKHLYYMNVLSAVGKVAGGEYIQFQCCEVTLVAMTVMDDVELRVWNISHLYIAL